MKNIRFVLQLSFIILIIMPHSASGLPQATNEDIPEYQMEEIVVVGERAQSSLFESTGATSVLTSSTLEELPANNLAEALRYIPGLTFVDRGGSGNIPIAIARGFFGGGETEYIRVFIDDSPMNDMRTGLVEWSQIPLSSIARIEVSRGGGSSLYGDAAIGAVINIVTKKRHKDNKFGLSLTLGEESDFSSDINFHVKRDKQKAHLLAHGDRIDGYRSHSDKENISFSGKYNYQLSSGNILSVIANVRNLQQHVPGPLTPDQIDKDRKQNNTLFDQDYKRRDLSEIIFKFRNPKEERTRFISNLGFRLVNQDQTRTLLLTPDFGDTQFHDERNSTYWFHAQLNHRPLSYSVTTGLDANYGTYKSKYFDNQDRSILNSDGTGHRTMLGVYFEAQKKFLGRLKSSAGLRYDTIWDYFKNSAENRTETNYTQFTPRVGLNYSYLSNPDYRGNMYVSWNRSFKAPTMDQLYDQRQIPSGPPGQTINISNKQLKPQRSTGFEAGLYQKLSLIKQRLYAEFTISGYRIEMEDEIDFDISSYQYGNITESRHDGVEATCSVYILPLFSASTSMNFMDVTFQSQQNRWKTLKLIPVKSISSSLHIFPDKKVKATLTHNYTGQAYLDDENTITIPYHHIFDAKLQTNFNKFQIFAIVKNIANEKYNSSGYLLFDPMSFSNVQLLFPARTRYFQCGISVSL